MNNVVLIGRLTRDPELRFIAGSGKAVANFTLAIDRNISKEQKQEYQKKGIPTADFIRIVVWGKQAENAASFLLKGRLVAINGSIQTNTYKTAAGEIRYTTDVIANRVEFLEWGDKSRDSSSNDYGIDPADFQAVEDDDDIPF